MGDGSGKRDGAWQFRVDLSGCNQIEMNAGDVFVVETPGGGGYGVAEDRD